MSIPLKKSIILKYVYKKYKKCEKYFFLLLVLVPGCSDQNQNHLNTTSFLPASSEQFFLPEKQQEKILREVEKILSPKPSSERLEDLFPEGEEIIAAYDQYKNGDQERYNALQEEWKTKKNVFSLLMLGKYAPEIFIDLFFSKKEHGFEISFEKESPVNTLGLGDFPLGALSFSSLEEFQKMHIPEVHFPSRIKIPSLEEQEYFQKKKT